MITGVYENKNDRYQPGNASYKDHPQQERYPEGHVTGPSQAFLPGQRAPTGRETQRQDFYIDDQANKQPVENVSGRVVRAGENATDSVAHGLSSAKDTVVDAGSAAGRKLENAGDAIADKIGSTKIF